MNITSRRVRYLMIVAALLADGCSSAHRIDLDAEADVEVESDADADADADSDSDGDADADEQPIDADLDDEPDGDFWEEFCTGPWYELWTDPVPTIENGVAADQESICSAAGEPVTCDRAVRVVLDADGAALERATGLIEIPSELLGLVVGQPSIAVEGSPSDPLTHAEISEMTLVPQGFSFNVSWPSFPELSEYLTSLVFQVELTVRCDESGTVTRTVSARSCVYLCFDEEARLPVWVSEGDLCTECEYAAEMAPSPVEPGAVCDGTALPRAIRLEVVPVARIGRALVLLAEHRGTLGQVRYQWQASAGTLSDPDQGGVVWEPPEGCDGGAELITVAVTDRDSAAVASLSVEASRRSGADPAMV